MTTINVLSGNPQDAINASQPGDTLVFDAEVYILDRPLYLPGPRIYFSHYPVIFRMSPNFQPDPLLEDCMIIFSGTGNQWLVKSIIDTGWMQHSSFSTT